MIGSNNLVFERNILQKGQSYIFQLLVYQTIGNILIGKDMKSINVNYGPIILQDSFDISPDCSERTFSSFVEWFATPFTLAIAADAQNLPLTYQFYYQFQGIVFFFCVWVV